MYWWYIMIMVERHINTCLIDLILGWEWGSLVASQRRHARRQRRHARRQNHSSVWCLMEKKSWWAFGVCTFWVLHRSCEICYDRQVLLWWICVSLSWSVEMSWLSWLVEVSLVMLPSCKPRRWCSYCKTFTIIRHSWVLGTVCATDIIYVSLLFVSQMFSLFHGCMLIYD
jgi:hypothetical protein